MSVNKAILIGRLGSDPDVRYTPGGQAVANFNIATDDAYTDKNGQKVEKTEWHKIVAWGRVGELCGQFLKKGREVYVEGKIETREWQDKDGNRRFTTEIKANQVTFLGSGQGRSDPTHSDPGGEPEYSAPRAQAPRQSGPPGGGRGGYDGPPGGGQGGHDRGGQGGYDRGNQGGYGGREGGGPSAPPPAQSGPPGGSFTDDDIPF